MSSSTLADGWPPSDHVPPLPPGEVHVWLASLDRDVGVLEGLLSADERERAGRFAFERHRKRFIAGRGVLRILAGAYRLRPPEEIRFQYSASGKPALAGAGSVDDGLRFNLSHAEGLGLFAFSRGREVGVDLERVGDESAASAIAAYLRGRENASLAGVEGEKRVRRLFELWAREEALVKARGDGLGGVNRSTLQDSESARWVIGELPPVPGFASALAVEGAGWVARDFRFALPGRE
jgi:4'-phosphopantetheinyl transferase